MRAVYCINRPISVPVPHAVRRAILVAAHKLRLIDAVRTTQRRWHAKLQLVTAPVVGVALLWASTCIGASVIRIGIVGDGNVQPYDVLVLFISLAYISCSLDATGGLRALAFYVSQKAGKSGHGLFATLYAFFFMSGIIIGASEALGRRMRRRRSVAAATLALYKTAETAQATIPLSSVARLSSPTSRTLSASSRRPRGSSRNSSPPTFVRLALSHQR